MDHKKRKNGGDKTAMTGRYTGYGGSRQAQRGFALAPILYMLGLVGVGAGVLFSGYSQILRSNAQMTNDLATKSDMQNALTVLSAASVLGSPNTYLCPPTGGTPGTNCSAANPAPPVKMAAIATATASQLPAATGGVPVATFVDTGTPQEYGVFATGSGIKLLDGYGHYYIYCRWEQLTTDSTDPAIKIISAGPDGTLQSKCGDAVASGDDQMQWLPATTVVTRAAVWMTTTAGSNTQAQFGNTGTQLIVDAFGDVTTPGWMVVHGTSTIGGAVSFGSTGNFTGTVTAPNFAGAFTGTSGDFSGNVTIGGTLGVTGATTLSSTLGVTGATTLAGLTAGSSTLTSITVTNDANIGGNLGVTGSTTLGGSLSAGSSTLASASITGNETIGGKLNVALPVTLGSNLIVIGTSFFGNTVMGSSGVLSIVGSATTSGDMVAGGNLSASGTLAVGGATTLSSTLGGTSATFSGSVTAASFNGYLNVGSGGSGINGVVPVANGGTGASNALNALANLTVTSGGYLNTSLLTTNLIPGGDLTNNSVGASQLDIMSALSGCSGGCAYNWGTVDANGRIVSAQNVITNVLTDGSGDSIVASGGTLTFGTGGSTAAVINSAGFLGLGTANPGTRLDVNGNVRIEMAAGTTTPNQLQLMNGATSERWALTTDGVTEGAGNSGSDLILQSYSNSGVVISSTAPLTLTRSGNATFSGTVTAPTFYGSGAGLSNIPASAITGITLGSTASATNPQRNNDATTGFYSPATATVAVAANGKEVTQWTSGGSANYLTNISAGSGVGPTIGVGGSDGSIALNLTPKGTSNVNVTSGALNIGSTDLGLEIGGLNGITFPSNDFSGIGQTIAIGPNALANNTGSGNNFLNLAIGANAMGSNPGNGGGGDFNLAVGNNALALETSGSDNTAVGNSSLYNTTSGNNNVGIGASTLQSNIQGNSNIAIGGSDEITNSNILILAPALYENTNGSYNVAVGVGSLFTGTTFSGNTGIGSLTGRYVTGNYNTIIGYKVASSTLTTGGGNILIGTSSAVDTPTTSTNNWLNIGNTIYGNLSAHTLGIGSGLTTISTGAALDLSSNSTTANSTLILPVGTTGARPTTGINGMVRYNKDSGVNAIEAYANNAWAQILTSATGAGSSTVYIGSALTAANPSIYGDATSGLYTPMGSTVSVITGQVERLRVGSSGTVTVLTGPLNISSSGQGLQLNGQNGISIPTTDTSGQGLAIGSGALASMTSGYRLNQAIGYQALTANTTGRYNTANGIAALTANLTGNSNAAFGGGALDQNQSGTANAALGSADASGVDGNGYAYGPTLNSNVSGSYNIGVGLGALSSMTAGSGVAVGYGALFHGTGASNTAFGYVAGYSVTSGYNNLILGPAVASTTLTTGSNNILIGTSANTDTPLGSTSNWLNIGNTIYGDLSTSRIAIGNGVTSIATGAALDLSANNTSANSSLLFPLGTTGTRPIGTNGMMRYNITNGKFEGYQAGSWQDILTSASGNLSYIGSSLTAANPQIAGDASSGLYAPPSIGSTVSIITGGVQRLTVGSTGNVGIGTASASTALQVQGIATVTNYVSTPHLNSTTGMLIDTANNASDIMLGAPFVTIKGTTGNVGIGTTSPLAVLHTTAGAVGTSNIAGLIYGSTTNGSFTDESSLVASKATFVVGSNWSNSNSSGAGLMNIYNASGSAFWVGNNGSVGIGSSIPKTGAALDLSNNTTTSNSTLILPVGTTAARPTTGVNGMVRYNSTTPAVEGYVNNVWTQFLTSATGAGSSTVYIGSALTAANPSIYGDATSGLYTPGGSTVSVITGGNIVEQWNRVASAVNYISVTPGATGVAPTITNGGSDTNGAGLGLTFTGKSATAAGTGGPITMTGGAGSGANIGGAIAITAGAGGATGAGATATFSGGTGGSTSGDGGAVTIQGGTPVAGNGGAVTVQGANGVGSNVNGGAISIAAGRGGTTGIGGDVTISAGQGKTANAGNLMLYSGSSIGTTGNSGNVTIGGGSENGNSGSPGTVSITGSGVATGANRTGGAVNVTGGVALEYSGGTGGPVTISGGAASTGFGGAGPGGIVTVTGGAGGGTDQNGGGLILSGGNSTGAGSSSINFQVAAAAASGTGANSATTKMTLSSAGNLFVTSGGIAVGTTSLTTGAALDLSSNNTSANSSLLFPLGTTGTRPIGTNGMMRYNITNGKFEGYQAGSWQDILTSASGNLSYIGSSLTAANPQITGDATSGLYTPGGSTVAVITGGNIVEQWNRVASAVNYLSVTPAASGSGPSIASAGSDPNVNLNLTPQGSTGQVTITANALNIASGSSGLKLGGSTIIKIPDGGLDTTSLAIGSSALTSQNSTTKYNIAIGAFAAQSLQNGKRNTVVGAAAGQNMDGGNLISGDTFVGSGAGQSDNGGYAADFTGDNTYIGAFVGQNASGGQNVGLGGASGYETDAVLMSAPALGGLTQGNYDTAIGNGALTHLTTGYYNVGLGYMAGQKLTTGANNLLLGQSVGFSILTTGSNNILIGTSSTVDTPTSSTNNWLNIGNTIYGDLSTSRIAIGNGVTSITTGAALDLSSNSTSANSSLILPVGSTNTRPSTGINGMVRYNNATPAIEGYINNSWQSLVAGSLNSGVNIGTSLSAANPQVSGDATSGLYAPAGTSSAISIITGGVQRLTVVPLGSVGIGTTNPQAALDVTGAIDIGGVNGISYAPDLTANASIAIGQGALAYQNIGTQTLGNVAVGYLAMSGSSLGATAIGNTAIGYQVLSPTTTGYNNTGVGYDALYHNSSGYNNAAVGYTALGSNTIGYYNSAFGYQALKLNTSGAYNTAMGEVALNATGSGSYNTGIGAGALAGTSKSYNTAVGAFAGNLVSTGSYNTIIGYNVGSALTVGSGNILIGTSSATDAPTISTGNWLNIGNTIYGDLSTSRIAIGNGVTSITTGAALDLSSNSTSANSSLLFPLGTTGTRPIGTNGMMRYNTTNGKFEGYQAGSWQDILTSASGNLSYIGSSLTAANPQIAGDATSGLYAPAVGSTVSIITGGTERVRVASSGYVGIGTTNPTSTLTLGGQQSWIAGLGAITQLTGPTDQAFTIAAATPTSYGFGNNLNLSASSGYTTAYAASGGSVNITAGNGVNVNSGTAAPGGSINLVSGNGQVSGSGGGLTWTGGTGGPAYYTSTGPGGGLTFTGGPGGSTTNHPGSAGGSTVITSGVGGAAPGAGYSAGNGGAMSLSSGAGGAASNSAGGTAGASGALTLQTAAGGSATGSGGTRTGGNSGNITIQTGAAGTGATSNGIPGTISLGVGGGTNMTIGTTGAVGIGTATPATGAALDLSNNTTTSNSSLILPVGTTLARPVTGVNGMVRYNGSLTAVEGYVNNVWTQFLTSATGAGSSTLYIGNSTSAANPSIYGDATSGLYTPGGSTVSIITGGTERVRVDSSGNVGIGLTNSSHLLAISGTDASGQGVLQATNTESGVTYVGIMSLLAPNLSPGQQGYFAIGQAASNNNWAGFGFTYNGAGSASNQFNVNFYGTPSVWTATAGGNSAIGFSNTDLSSTLSIYNGTASTGATQLLVQGGAAAGDAGTNQLFRINQGGGTTGLFVVQGNGTVGIGTSSPATGAALDLSNNTTSSNSSLILPVGTTLARPVTGVNGMVRYNGSLTAVEGYVNNVWTQFLTSATGAGSSTLYIGNSTSAANPSIYGDATSGLYTPGGSTVSIIIGGAQRLTVGSTGNVGIGANAPSQLLSVGTNNSFTVDASGNLAATTAVIGNSSVSPVVVSCPGCSSVVGNPSGTYSYAGTYGGKNYYQYGSYYLYYAPSSWDIGKNLGDGGSNVYWYSTAGSGITPPYGVYTNYNGSSGTLTTSAGTVTNLTVSTSGNVVTGGNLTVQSTNVSSFVGSVGIGTTAPLSLLDIAGGLAVGSYAGTQAAPTNGLIVSGQVGIGSSIPKTGAALDLSYNSTTSNSSLILPVGTTAARPTTGVNGMMRYNSSSGTFEAYQSNAWQSLLTTGGAGSTIYLGTALTAANPQINGDATTGLYTPVGISSTVSIITGGTEQVRVGSSGSVSIGTTSASQKLEVAGNVNLTAGTGKYYIGNTAILGNGSLTTGSGQALAINTGVVAGSTSNGNNITMIAGDGGSSSGSGGNITIQSGGGGTTGTITIQSPANTVSRLGGSLVLPPAGYVANATVLSGPFTSTNPGGGLQLLGGGGYSYGGDVLIQGGIGGSGGGNIYIQPGINGAYTGGYGNTFIGVGSSNDIRGNIAIGTSKVPLSKLDVAGNVTIGSGTAYAGVTAAPSNGLIVQGVVGIGTSSPANGAALDLSYNSTTSNSTLILPVGTTAARPTTGVNGMMRYNSSSGTFEAYQSNAWQSLLTTGGAGSTIYLGTALTAANPQINGDATTGLYTPGGSSATVSIITAGAQRLTVVPLGSVGVGTVSPLALLSVGNGSLADANLPIQISTGASSTEANYAVNKNGAYGFLLGYKNNNGNLGSYANYTGGYMRQVTTDPFAIVVANTTLATLWDSSGDVFLGNSITSSAGAGSVLTILHGGQVGIGTVSPATGAALDLSANNTTSNSSLILPVGTTGTRPTAGINGMVRYNSTSGITGVEAYANNVWGTVLTSATGVGSSTVYIGSSLTAANPSLYGDATSGLYTPGGSTVSIITGGVPQLTVASSGYVGIGTGGPLDLLHVYAASNNALMGVQSGSNSYWAIQANSGSNSLSIGPLASIHNVTQTLNLLSGGNVGINIMPSAALDINTQSSSGMMRLRTWDQGGTYADISWGTNDNGNMDLVRIRGSANSDNLQFLTNSTAQMTINASGQVGIGSTSPKTGAVLDLSNNTTTANSTLILPVGTTSARPATGVNGMVRYNSTTPAVEGYVNNVWTQFLTSATGAGSSTVYIGSSLTAANPSIYGDATSGLYAPPVGSTVSIITGGVQRLTVGTTGYVGIGTAAPLAELHATTGAASTATVAGLIYGSTSSGTFTDEKGVTTPTATMLVGSNWTNSNSSGAGLLNAYNASGSIFWVGNNGNVGIGTTSPNAMLDVAQQGGTGSNNALELRAGNSAGYSSNNQILLGFNGTAQYQDAIKTRHQGASAAGNDIDFYIWNYGVDAAGTVGTKSVMTLDGTGDVGIGSTIPRAILDLSQSTNALLLPIGTAGDRPTGLNGMMRYNSNSNSFEAYQSNAWQSLLTTGGAGSTIYLGTALTAANPQINGDATTGLYTPVGISSTVSIITGGAQRLTVGSTGYVGIGTTSPTAPLHVRYASANGGQTTPVLTLDNPSGGYNTVLAFQANGTNTSTLRSDAQGDLVINATGGVFIAYNDLGTPSKVNFQNGNVVINTSGSVGIATTNPQSLLDVAGGMAVGSYAGVTAAPTNGLIVSGNVGIGTTNPLSALDVRGQFDVATSDPRVNLIDTSLGTTSAAPDWIIDNNADTFRLFRQPNISTAGNVYMSITSTGGINFSGNVGLGSSLPRAILDLSQSTSALLLPIGTATNRPTGINGMMRYNSSSNTFEAYQSNAWQSLLTTGGAGSTIYLGTALTAANPQINGDATTGLYTPVGISSTVSIITGGTQRLTVGSTGYVGINNTSPYQLFDVEAGGTGPQIAASFGNSDYGSTTSEARIVFNEGGNNYFQGISGAYNSSAPYLGFSVSSTTNTWAEKMRITSGGNVAIGTTSASQKLEVAGNVNLTSSTAGYYIGNTSILTNGGLTTGTGQALAISVGTAATSTSNGNALTITAGSAGSTSGNGGALTISSGQSSNGSAGNVVIQSGVSSGGWTGGSLTLTPGTYSSAETVLSGAYSGVTGGGLRLYAGDSRNGQGSPVTIQGGGGGYGGGGNVYIVPGTGGCCGSGAYNTGNIFIGMNSSNNVLGNVTIGTSLTPVSKLDVAGNVTIGSGTAYAGVTAAPTNGLIVQGVVGIGTSSPATGAALDLSYNSTTSNSSLILPVGTTAARPTTGVNGMMRYNSSSGTFEAYQSNAWQSLLTTGGAGSTIYLGTSTTAANPQINGDATTGLYTPTGIGSTVSIVTGGTERVRVGSTGNVGIGAGAPLGKLSVLSSDSGSFGATAWSNQYSVFGPNAGSATGAALGLGYSSIWGGVIIALAPGVSWQPMTLGASSFSFLANGGTQGLYQDSSGHVGIGTTAPNYALDVNGLVNTNASYYAQGASPSVVLKNTGGGADAKYWMPLTINGNTLVSYVANDANNSAAIYENVTRSGNSISSITFPNGNVGIGTTGPNTALQVNGTSSASVGTYNDAIISAYASGTSQGLQIGVNSTGSSSTSYAWVQSALYGTAASSLILQPGIGNVGIGTTAPNVTLHVQGGGVNGFARFTNSDFVSSTTGSGLLIGPGAASGNTYTRIMAYSAGFSAWNNLILQDGGGSVGIGTTSPVNELDVNGSLAVGSYAGTAAGAANELIVSGYVGIGTPVPSYPLNVQTGTAVGTNDNLAVGASSGVLGSGSGILFGATFNSAWGGSDYGVRYSGAIRYLPNNSNIYGSSIPRNHRLGFFTVGYNAGNDTPVEQMSIQSNGYVGIGTTTPSYTLQVNGSVAGTSAYNNLSDQRLKKNVVTLDHALDKIEQLRGVSFDWKTPEERSVGKGFNLPLNEPQVGFIAQEVEKVLPQAVTHSAEGIRNIQESKVVPLLVEAVKEQNSQIKSANAAIDRKLAALEQRIDNKPTVAATEPVLAVSNVTPTMLLWVGGGIALILIAGMGGLAFMLMRTRRELRQLQDAQINSAHLNNAE